VRTSSSPRPAFGGWLVNNGRATIGTLIAFASALLYAYRPVTNLARAART
jgi:ABC-type bacteriocin/lantibiotic exporter with double-glycine peptidase domain